MRRALWMCGWIGALSWGAASADAGEKAKPDPAAERMMIEAHQARSQWGQDFPGFKATVVARIDGDVARGKATVGPDGDVSLEMPEGPARAWTAGQLESIVMHRLAATRERYDVSFADDVTEHPLGRLIKFPGGDTHSLYRIRDDVITEVHRTLGKTKFTISITQVARNEDGKTLPGHFNVSYWDAESGALVSNEDFQDGWTRVGDYDLPHRRLSIRTAKDQRRVAELTLKDHKLLE